MVRGPVMTTVAISDLRLTTNHGHVLQHPVIEAIGHHKNEPRRSEPSGSGCLKLGFYRSAARGVGGWGGRRALAQRFIVTLSSALGV